MRPKLGPQDAHVNRQDRARDCGEAAGHQGVELGQRHSIQVRPHNQGSLRLTDEHVGRDRHGFSTRDAENTAHHLGEQPDQQLHDAKVVKHGHQRREEKNRR